MPAGRIADKTGMSLALVTHHLETMQNAGVVRVSRVSKNIKNRDMKHYRAVLAILIIPEESYAKAPWQQGAGTVTEANTEVFRDRNRRAVFMAGRKICWFHGTCHRTGGGAGIVRADSTRPTCVDHIRTTRADRGGAGNSDTWIGHRAGFGLRKEIDLLASRGYI